MFVLVAFRSRSEHTQTPAETIPVSIGKRGETDWRHCSLGIMSWLFNLIGFESELTLKIHIERWREKRAIKVKTCSVAIC